MPLYTARRTPANGQPLRPVMSALNEGAVAPARPAPAPARPAPAPTPATVPTDALAVENRAATGLLQSERFGGNPTLEAVAAGRKVLKKGMQDPAMPLVQQALNDMAFVIPGGTSTNFGEQTTQALKNFQAMAQLPQTGTLDAATLQALDAAAPPAGKTLWDPGVTPSWLPDPAVNKTKKARVVVSLSQHRAFLFDKQGQLMKIYGVRSGKDGNNTVPGVKIIDGKNNDPTAVSNQLWPDTNGRAFGTRLLNLTDYDPATGKIYKGKHVGQELHGTYQDTSIGRNFSHGCVGLRNVDIEEIFDAVDNRELVVFQA